jgi:subfamily B ATP-binding cassette protein MsbA
MESDKRNALLRYLAYARPYWPWVLLVVTAGVAKFTLPLGVAYLTGQLVDWVVTNEHGLSRQGRLDLLWWFGGALAVVAVLELIAIFLRGYWTTRTSTQVAFDIRQDLYKHLQRLSLGFHQSYPTGSLLSRLMSDISVSQHMINQGIINVCIDGVTAIVALAMLVSISWELTLITLAALPFYGIVFRRLNPALRQASRDVQEQTSVMSGSAVERLHGIAVIQSFAQEPEESRFFAAQANELRGMALRRGKLNHSLQAMSHFLVGLSVAAVWATGAYFAVNGKLSVGELIWFTGAMGQLYMPVRRFSQINIMFQQSMAAIERVFAIFDVVPELRSKPDAVDKVPDRGEVEFDHVDFAYEQGTPVLQDVAFRIAPGERVAIVGESGAGKSTLVTLLPRLYDVTDGSIRVDGVDVRDYRLRKLRRAMGIVLQETILFSGTVRENLRYGRKDASMEDILEAAQMANAHEFIMDLPEGYDSVIGEQGASLSGGQRQRISLARTILQNPRILILDEATSALDSESENLITEALHRVMEGRTCLIIAHRLSTIMDADRILVFQHGRLVEQGPHRELLEKGGAYRHLFEQQFGPLQDLLDRSNLRR